MTTVAVDFDGVIHAYSRGWHDGSIYDPPVPGAIDAVVLLMREHSVFVHTSRAAGQVTEWLVAHGIRATADDRCPRCRGGGRCRSCGGTGRLRFWTRRGQVLVTDRKLPAIAYVDDRGIRFSSWDQALRDLARLR